MRHVDKCSATNKTGSIRVEWGQKNPRTLARTRVCLCQFVVTAKLVVSLSAQFRELSLLRTQLSAVSTVQVSVDVNQKLCSWTPPLFALLKQSYLPEKEPGWVKEESFKEVADRSEHIHAATDSTCTEPTRTPPSSESYSTDSFEPCCCR